MIFAGDIPILAGPEAIAAALHDANVLHRLLPGCERVECLAPGRFRAFIARNVGMVTLRAEPEIVLVASVGGLALSLDASSRIFGTVAARLELTMQPETEGTRLSWNGELATTGPVQRLLSLRQTQLLARVTALFTALKRVVEGG